MSTTTLAAQNARALDNDQFAAMLPQALTNFDIALVLLNEEDFSLQWSSAAALRLIPSLVEEGIQATLERMTPSLASLLEQAGKQNDANTIASTLSATLPASVGSPKLNCTICQLEPNTVAIKICDSRDHFSQLQSYMEEREKLFTTSRTISVSEMATTLAHELNQPIGTVSNILKGVKSRLGKKSEGMEEIIQALDRAIDQSQFAARIITRIRDFTQSRQPSRIECDIFALLKQSADLLDWVVDKAGVKVVFHPPQEPILVNGDPTMLQQVITNLIRNAVDSMRDAESGQRELSLTVRLKEGDAQIEIADTGHGLSESAESNLFVPFVTQKSQGMGVGLNICRSFVELHQGRLWLAQNDSGGCTSFVVLPIIETNS